MGMRRCRRIVIGIGSNAGNAAAKVESAIKWLSENFRNVRTSSVYPTLPEADAVPGLYYNAVAVAESRLSRYEVINMLKEYERENGRTPERKLAGDISIDLDLVYDGNTVLRPQEISRYYFSKGFKELC